MSELTEWDVEQIKRICDGDKTAGRLVLTKKGLLGRTFNHEDSVNDKTIVHVPGGKLLCDPQTLTLKGYID